MSLPCSELVLGGRRGVSAPQAVLWRGGPLAPEAAPRILIRDEFPFRGVFQINEAKAHLRRATKPGLKFNTWHVCIFELHIAVVANAPDLQENKKGGFCIFRIISI